MKHLKTAVLFPLRSEDNQLSALACEHSFEYRLTPYLESTELRSSRGLNKGLNVDFIAEPDIPEEYLEYWAECNVIIAMDLPSGVIDLFPHLEWVQGVSAGHDHMSSELLENFGTKLSTAKGIASAAISEFIFARLLQDMKHLRLLDEQQLAKTWQVKFGNQLKGKTIGIIGVGSIGGEVAKRAQAFEMNVLGIRSHFDLGCPSAVDELLPFSDLDRLLKQSDVVLMAAPSTNETENLFDASKFAMMKRGSVFINIARGIHVIESDLALFLSNGHLRSAIIDVVKNEPLHISSDLWDAPNLYLSPHCSVSFDDYEKNAVDLFVDNALRFSRGENLLNQIF